MPHDYTADIDGGKIGCGYSENNLNIFYRPEDLDYWNFNKWKFTFDFTALTSENKPMFYILYRDVKVFEFGAKYCKSGGVLCNYNYTGSHHCELSANIQNMTLNVTIDNVLVKTINNVQFYPQCIQFQSIYNPPTKPHTFTGWGFAGIVKSGEKMRFNNIS